ncbi:MAG: hypothetical protein ABFS30_17930, partial [Pseudomonadota bacterium]
AASLWLPADFDFTFVGPRPDGAEATFGSLTALREKLVSVSSTCATSISRNTFAWSPVCVSLEPIRLSTIF